MSHHNQCLPFEKSHELQILLCFFQYFRLQHVLSYIAILEDTTSLFFGLGAISHTSFFIMDWYSSVMASAHSSFEWLLQSK
jgi:hypothetical protein